MKALSNGYELPTGWDEVYLEQFIDLKNINPELNTVERQLQILSILTNTLPKDAIWDDMDVEEFSDLWSNLNWLRTEPNSKLSSKIDELFIINVTTISVGEFIDLQYYFKDHLFENLPKICAILYRKMVVDEYGNPIYEPYGTYDLDERCDYFYDLSIDNLYGIISYFIDFKDKFFESYQPLFNPISDEEEDDGYIPTPEEEAEIKQEIIAEGWAWEKLIYNLADGDLTKVDAVTKLGLVFVFNMLSMRNALKI